MLLSARTAAKVLAESGIARAQARTLLAAGLAGAGARVSTGRADTANSVLLFEEELVRRLASRPAVDWKELAGACPRGLYVARLARPSRVDVTLDLTRDWHELVEQLRVQPPMTAWSTAILAARIRGYGPLPWTATLCGQVVLGAEAEAVHAVGDTTEFTLSPPGGWYDAVRERSLPTPPGGQPGHLWTPPLAG